jgi:hypothetical protein
MGTVFSDRAYFWATEKERIAKMSPKARTDYMKCNHRRIAHKDCYKNVDFLNGMRRREKQRKKKRNKIKIHLLNQKLQNMINKESVDGLWMVYGCHQFIHHQQPIVEQAKLSETGVQRTLNKRNDKQYSFVVSKKIQKCCFETGLIIYYIKSLVNHLPSFYAYFFVHFFVFFPPKLIS